MDSRVCMWQKFYVSYVNNYSFGMYFSKLISSTESSFHVRELHLRIHGILGYSDVLNICEYRHRSHTTCRSEIPCIFHTFVHAIKFARRYLYIRSSASVDMILYIVLLDLNNSTYQGEGRGARRGTGRVNGKGRAREIQTGARGEAEAELAGMLAC